MGSFATLPLFHFQGVVMKQFLPEAESITECYGEFEAREYGVLFKMAAVYGHQ